MNEITADGEEKRTQQRKVGRYAAFSFAAVTVAGAVVWAAISVAGFDLRCDDACSSSEFGWIETNDAWQWYPYLLLGLTGLVGSAFAFVSALRRRWRRFLTAELVTYLLFVAWWLLIDSSG